MTTRSRPTTRFSKATLLAATIAATVALLAGCAPTPTPGPTHTTKTPKPTPTATGVPAPTSSDQAITDATAAAQADVALYDKVLSEGGKNPNRLAAHEVDPRLSQSVQGAQAIAKRGDTVKGHGVLTVNNAYASSSTYNGKAFQFGSVTLTACYDGSGISDKLPDGTDAPRPPHLATINTYNVLYDPSTQSWVIRTVNSAGTPC